MKLLLRPQLPPSTTRSTRQESTGKEDNGKIYDEGTDI